MSDGTITDALRDSEMARDPQTFHWLTWRVGDRIAAHIYAQVGAVPSDEDVQIGEMDTERLAREAVNAHNAVLRDVQSPEFGKSVSVSAGGGENTDG